MLIKKNKNDETQGMRPRTRILILCAIAVATLVIAANLRPAEEVAESYYQSGLRYLEEGDDERARLEFENVFQNDGFHREARLAYAGLALKEGETPEAYRHYLLLAEQAPKYLPVRHILAALAYESDLLQGVELWSEVERHTQAAMEIDPTHPKSISLSMLVDYYNALQAKETDVAKKIAAEARTILDTRLDDDILRRIVLDDYLVDEDPEKALVEVNLLIESGVPTLNLHATKLGVLRALDDVQVVREQFYYMYELFPDSRLLQNEIVRWHIQQEEIGDAENFMRQQAEKEADPISSNIRVLRFIEARRGRDAALTEVANIIAESENDPERQDINLVYKGISANYTFEGDTEAGISGIRALLNDAQEDTDITRDIRTLYANMLNQTDERDKAMAQVARVLTGDSSHVRALGLRAGWQLEADDVGGAVVNLRRALNQSPEDGDIILLLARAHLQEGAFDLAAEQLARAYAVSGDDSEVGFLYADFLIGQGDFEAASNVLLTSLRNDRENMDLIALLATVYARQADWSELANLVNVLQRLPENAEAAELAQKLKSLVYLGQEDTTASLLELEKIILQDENNEDVVVLAIQIYIDDGRYGPARILLDRELAKKPENVQFQQLSAVLYNEVGDRDTAITLLQGILRRNPSNEPTAVMLYDLFERAGQKQASLKVLDAILSASPKSDRVRWIRATRAEADGEPDMAIAIYEELHSENPINDIAINNLASMLTTYRNDQASIERAAQIVRNLTVDNAASFQETYGWVQYRSGNFREASAHLSAAARSLPEDPFTQLHAGLNYAALGNKESAQSHLEKAIMLSDGNDNKLLEQQLDLARDILQRLPRTPAGQSIIPYGLLVLTSAP